MRASTSPVATQADLTVLATGIVDVEDPLGVAAAVGALGATLGVEGGAMKEGAAEDAGEGGEPGEKTAALVLMCHLYR